MSMLIVGFLLLCCLGVIVAIGEPTAGGSAGQGSGGAAGGAGTATPSAAPAPMGATPGVTTTSGAAAAAPAPSAAQAGSPGGAGAGGSGASPAQTATQAWNLRNYIAEQSGNPALANQWPDDQAAAAQLMQLARMVPQLRQRATEYDNFAPHMTEFQAWQAEKQKADAAKVAAEKNYWNAPPFEEAWLAGVEQDPNTGQLVAKPGFPRDLPGKIEAFRHFQRQKMDSFMKDPIKAIEGGLQETVGKIVKEAIAQQLGQYEGKQTAQSYVQSNLSWLVQHDANKMPMRDGMTGGYVLTPAGQRFTQYVMQLEQAGMTNHAAIQWAEARVEGDLMRMALQAQQQGAGGGGAAAGGNIGGPAIGGANRIAAAGANPPARGAGLADMLRTAMAANGITDEQLRGGH
jgi:hypothetical protein